MLYKNNKNISSPKHLNNQDWQRFSKSEEFGECYVDRCILEQGLSIASSSYTPNCDLNEESIIEKSMSTFSLTYGLEGQSYYRVKSKNNEEMVFSSNNTTLSTFGNSVGERIYKANEKVSQLRIIIDGSAFERYKIPFDLDAKNIPIPQVHWHAKTTIHTQYYIKRLMNLAVNQQTERPLEKNILVFNLISEQLSLLDKKGAIPSQEKAISYQDEYRIIQARCYMIQHMSQPLTLAFIGQQIGISEGKLKLGFKAIYGTSPYKMLLEIRMSKALELLESGYQISQTAYSVGYEYPSNFSAAFNRFYGQAPKYFLQ